MQQTETNQKEERGDKGTKVKELEVVALGKAGGGIVVCAYQDMLTRVFERTVYSAGTCTY
ncbi:MAG: hypothetical protein FRX49_02224 [Trebouxia sp. A1-2]|nr:MAG: hypothetical protein FRX49_02224 [Trebouxia sp. A1-2]